MGIWRMGVIMGNDEILKERQQLEELIFSASQVFILSNQLKNYRKQLKQLQARCPHDGMTKGSKGVCYYCGKVFK